MKVDKITTLSGELFPCLFFSLSQDYYVADASEEQVFLVVTHNLTTGDSNLYISDVTGSKYSKTLDNIVYFNPEGAHSTSWLR